MRERSLTGNHENTHDGSHKGEKGTRVTPEGGTLSCGPRPRVRSDHSRSDWDLRGSLGLRSSDQAHVPQAGADHELLCSYPALYQRKVPASSLRRVRLLYQLADPARSWTTSQCDSVTVLERFHVVSALFHDLQSTTVVSRFSQSTGEDRFVGPHRATCAPGDHATGDKTRFTVPAPVWVIYVALDRCEMRSADSPGPNEQFPSGGCCVKGATVPGQDPVSDDQFHSLFPTGHACYFVSCSARRRFPYSASFLVPFGL